MPSVAEWWKNETFIPLDWSPPPVPEGSRPRRWLRRLAAIGILVLLATSGGLAWLAWDEHGMAQRNEALVHVQAAQLKVLRSQAAQVQALKSQVANNQQLLSSADTVAGELQACIDASGPASNDIFGFLSDANKKADSICNTAEADYQQLLSSSGSAH